MVVPLGEVAAVGLALGLAVRPRVTAAAAAAGGLVRPVPADVVAVHPRLALAHAAHVQGHRRVAGQRVEVGLKTITVTHMRGFRNGTYGSLVTSLGNAQIMLLSICRTRTLTLCHVKGVRIDVSIFLCNP